MSKPERLGSPLAGWKLPHPEAGYGGTSDPNLPVGARPSWCPGAQPAEGTKRAFCGQPVALTAGGQPTGRCAFCAKLESDRLAMKRMDEQDERPPQGSRRMGVR